MRSQRRSDQGWDAEPSIYIEDFIHLILADEVIKLVHSEIFGDPNRSRTQYFLN